MRPIIAMMLIFSVSIFGFAAEPDPHAGVDLKKSVRPMSLEEAKAFWSYQPIQEPKSSSSIDQFVREKLERANLKPSPPTDPRMLIRRVYFDLIGLPPPFEVVEKFAAKPTPESYSAIIDELLARPEYGQRWGRHWLDVARYSDTTEQSVDGERRIPFAHTYRDYVIEAFNSDKPFNRFVLEQISADRMPASEKADLRALGFLTVGRRFAGNADAPQLIVDDRIDVIGRGFLGLTLACARCHDHKFDAIPTADYYSLYGILNSVVEPLDKPEVSLTPDSEAVAKYRAERAKLLKQYDEHTLFCIEKSNRLLREMTAENLKYVVNTSANHRTVQGFIPLDTPRGLLLPGGPKRWEALFEKHREHPFFRPWHQLIALNRDGFQSNAKVLIAKSEHPLLQKAFEEKSPGNMLEVAEIYGKLIGDVLKSESAEEKKLADLIVGKDSPLPVNRDEIADDLMKFVTENQIVLRMDGEKAGGIAQKLQALEATAPVERAMSLHASAKPFEPRVLMRGELEKPGDAVPRRFLHVLSTVDSRTYADDGRLQLAQAIANDRNPLTARVIVNRVWQHHFGRGLVTTPDDFGVSGDRPVHTEILDYLATRFMRDGWSIKKLHRLILQSATYQQGSGFNAVAAAKDPDNRLLWRMPPRRLEFEPLRDSILHVAGKLDCKMGGRSALLTDTNNRRAVYGYTDRFRIPALLRNFDVANPDTSISRRAESIHPLQSLFLLNSPFVRNQAEALLKRPEIASIKDRDARITAIYRIVYSRSPDADELSLASGFVMDDSNSKQWASFAQGLMLANEFAFVD